LSVVVASVDALDTIDQCLGSLRTALQGLESEVLVVHDGDVALASRVRDRYSWARALEADAASLVPELWASGFRASRGDVVAFTTGHSVVGPAWARSLLGALEAGATGAGGGLEADSNAGVLEAAVYYLRYSSFMPPVVAGPAHEIPGDNAAYRRDALERHRDSFDRGFWEVDFHRRIRPEGGKLVLVSDATAVIRPVFRLSTILKHRFRHGRYFGDYRVREAGQRPWRVTLAAPLVPLVMAARVCRKVSGVPRRLWLALRALPALVVVAGAWAAGEAVGAMDAAREGSRA
jgi:hypothetical protein